MLSWLWVLVFRCCLRVSISAGAFHLTPEQRRFKDLLTAYPTLASYWNFEACRCDEAGVEQVMGVFSRGEPIMAAFFRRVWSGNDAHSFGFIDAVTALGPEDLQMIHGWAKVPFFP